MHHHPSETARGRRVLLVVAATAGLLLPAACAGEPTVQAQAPEAPERGGTTAEHLRISQAWVPAPAGPHVAAVYFTVENTGAHDDAMTGVSTDLSDSAELCRTEIDEDGTARMETAAEIAVPAGGSATLEEGGFHGMVYDVADPPDAGDEVQVTLTFASGAEAGFSAPVPEKPEGDQSESEGGGHHH